MRIILLGPPGAGKGTQAQLVCDHFKIPSIATGDMLRATAQSNTALGRRIEAIILAGSLVPDDIVIRAVQERLAKNDCHQGFLFDGFPRTIPQAESLLAANITLDAVLNIVVDDQAIVERISGRRVHAQSGRSYHLKHHPPQQKGLDDITGEPLTQRKDDQAATVQQRLNVYHQQTKPLIAYYQQLSDKGDLRYAAIDGMGAVDGVYHKVMAALG